jgi:hypothetical protein
MRAVDDAGRSRPGDGDVWGLEVWGSQQPGRLVTLMMLAHSPCLVLLRVPHLRCYHCLFHSLDVTDDSTRVSCVHDVVRQRAYLVCASLKFILASRVGCEQQKIPLLGGFLHPYQCFALRSLAGRRTPFLLLYPLGVHITAFVPNTSASVAPRPFPAVRPRALYHC